LANSPIAAVRIPPDTDAALAFIVTSSGVDRHEWLRQTIVKAVAAELSTLAAHQSARATGGVSCSRHDQRVASTRNFISGGSPLPSTPDTE
jgi:hypothetical protein